MNDEIAGFSESPAEAVQAAFEVISRKAMQNLSFLHPDMPVHVSPFSLFEGQWVGCVITPWMLSALIFPGPDQRWPQRKVSEKIGLKLPFGDMTFTVGELDGVSQYFTCSLMPPLDHNLTAEQGVRLAVDCPQMLLSIPQSDPYAVQASRRSLLFGRRNSEYA
ncbi:hydrogenase-2 assembly chaperone [Citrobacter amalonaticus]|uniref:hydrogenase-2 assembly chaperone n=1 Tax=Citrobacter amalonaticus TaxID=35703 RepID=UPI002879087D|nr:hydrogenase-2 assembly chaperone [Citrobacter amalonaticus]MDS4039447.1 hydrogenase-2 assembly chaperone [Citrobacter amalonaticus]